MRAMKIKPILSLFAAAALAGCSTAPKVAAPEASGPKPLKVLMIGNSFAVCVLKHMPQCAKDAGVGLDLVSLYIGGCSLERHWGNVAKAETDREFAPYAVTWNYSSLEDQKAVPFAGLLRKMEPSGLKGYANIPEMLKADKWDVVTIQQASHFSWDPATYEPFATKLVAKIRELAPQAEIVVQETWSYCTADKRIFQDGGPGSWGFDQKGMYDRLSSAYADLAKKNGFRRIPTGTAVQNYRAAVDVTDPHNDVVGNFWKDKDGKDKIDSIHLNPSGEYLQALTWLDTLFGVDARNVRYAPKGLDPKRAETIRRAAAEASEKYRKAAR